MWNWLWTAFRSRSRTLAACGNRARSLQFERLQTREVLAAVADLVAYRAVTPNIDYRRYAIGESVETSATLGAGIRINGDDDNRNGVVDFREQGPITTPDDDLVRVDVRGSGASMTLRWTGEMRVWTSRTKTAAVGQGATVAVGQQLWVEYVSMTHTQGDTTRMTLTAIDGASQAVDTVVFHTFRSQVVVIGGLTQVPSRDMGTSVFAIGTSLYQRGYDVRFYGEYDVRPDGQGAAFDDAVSGVARRGVTSVAIVGFSYGGGAGRDLSAALARSSVAGRYTLAYTASIDGIVHYSLAVPEQRLPTGTAYHDNYYQRRDLFIRGDAVAGANNVNVSNTSWGRSLRHLPLARSTQLQTAIARNLETRMNAR